MKSYVINLDRSPERLDRFFVEAQNFGWKVERFSAIDCQDLDLQHEGEKVTVRHKTLPDIRQKVISEDLHAGHLGCTLSHLLLWQRLLDSDEKLMCIFEDDAVIEQPNDLPDFPPDMDFLFLSDRVSALVPEHVESDEEFDEWVEQTPFAPMVPGCGTEAYIVTRSGAEKGLALMEDQFWPLDLQLMAYGHGTIQFEHGLASRRDKSLPVCKIYASTTPYTAHIDEGLSYINTFKLKRLKEVADQNRDSERRERLGKDEATSAAKPVVHAFIFSWPGQFEKAVSTQAALATALGVQPTVINCDLQTTPGWLDLGDLFFTRQFLHAVDLFEGDVLMHVQADATCTDWGRVLERAMHLKSKYDWGIFAPNVDYTPWSDHVKIMELEDQVWEVTNTDETCWMIDSEIINAFKEESHCLVGNEFGWGIDLLMGAISRVMRRPVLRDYSILVDHPRGAGYASQKAGSELADTLSRMRPDLRRIVELCQEGKVEAFGEFIG